MITTTLTFLSDQLKTFVDNKQPLGIMPLSVLVDRLVDPDTGKINFKNGDCVFLTLANLEEETVGKSQLPYFKTPDDKVSILNPDIKMNLYVQFSGYSDASSTDLGGAYVRSLRLLDQVILCFQYRNVFISSQYPYLEENGVEKIILEPVSLTFEQTNHLWASIGAKYMPSVIYKCRTLTFRETVATPLQPLIKELNSSQNSRS